MAAAEHSGALGVGEEEGGGEGEGEDELSRFPSEPEAAEEDREEIRDNEREREHVQKMTSLSNLKSLCQRPGTSRAR